MSVNKTTPDYIFEISWEVCNKVGGIYTVLSTRAKTILAKTNAQLVFIGPDLWKETEHFDLYRLEEYGEFLAAGLDESIADDAVSLIEWPEIMEDKPVPRIEVRIERTQNENVRAVNIEFYGMEESERAHFGN